MSSLAPSGAQPIARVANRYLLLEELGSRGLTIVFRARDEATGRFVALKQLLASLAGAKRKSCEALFAHEYHTLLRLSHPRVLEVYECGISDSGPYYTMELLDERVAHVAPLPYALACSHLRDVAMSLARLHAQRLLHRKVSVENARLTSDGRAKLIDFGALQPFGIASDVPGTPSCVAPEMVRGMPLDPRSDLYALGAVGYFALTGHHAFPARRIDQLPALWELTPPRPSELVSEIPSALDALILSLLSADPAGRPGSAIAVIEQLTAIAGLGPEPAEDRRQMQLPSGRLVGRGDEQQWMDRRIQRCLSASGTQLLIEGPAGIGKTRLFHEFGLQAQLRGVSVVKAEAGSAPEPFGVAARLAVQLLAICPDSVLKLGAGQPGLLAHLSTPLREALGSPGLAELARAPSERRVVFQTALHEWFSAVARDRPLLLGVDDVHLADDDSAAFLAALGSAARKLRLIVMATQCTGAPVRAPASVRALRKRSTRLKLGRLDARASGELLRSIFGEAPERAHIAGVLHHAAGGVPRAYHDLVQLLVRRGIASAEGGAFVLPAQLEPEALPDHVEEIAAQRLHALGATARGLAEVLSVHEAPVPLELCLLLAEAPGDAAIHAAIGELLAAQVLRLEGGKLRFERDSLRSALYQRLPEALRSARHQRAADAMLAAAGGDLRLQIEGANHLLRAGQALRGARLLARAGRRFLQHPGEGQSVGGVTLALCAALAVHEKLGSSKHEIAGVLLPLMSLAFYSRWALVAEHGERALELAMAVRGLEFAQRLRPRLGGPLALGCGFAWSGLRIAALRPRELRDSLRDGLEMICASVPAIVGTAAICADVAAVERMRERLTAFTLFGEDQAPAIVEHVTRMASLVVQGRHGEALADIQLDAWLKRPRTRTALGEECWRVAQAALLWTRAMLRARCFGEAALEHAREVEAVGVQRWTLAADFARLCYYAYRGESDPERHYRERVELFAVQAGASWQFETLSLQLSLEVQILTGDTLGIRRTHERMARLSAEIPSLRLYADAARAAYLGLRGQYEPAVAMFERVTQWLKPLRGQHWGPLYASYASALNQAGRHEQAKQLLRDVLSAMSVHDETISTDWIALHCQLAAAEAGLGRHAAALDVLEPLLAQYGAETNGLLLGLLHKSRAEVALGMSDRPAFERHFNAMEQRFRNTRNPVLVAQAERLGEGAVRAGLRNAADQAAASALGEALLAPRERSANAHHTVHDIAAAADPFDYALKLVLQRARARIGYLFKYDCGVMRLRAATFSSEPPPELIEQLEEAARSAPLDPALDARGVHPGFQAQFSTRPRAAGPSQRPRDVPEGRVPDRDRGGPAANAAPDEPTTQPEPHTDTQRLPEGVNDVAGSMTAGRHIVRLLKHRHAGVTVVAGGLILEAEPRHAGRLARGFLEAVAEAIQRRS